MRLHQARALHTVNSRCIPHPRKEDRMSLPKMDDYIKELAELALDQGWRLEPTSSNKLLWYPPDKSVTPVTTPLRLTGRGKQNITQALRRAGLVTEKEKTVMKGPNIEVVVMDHDAPLPEQKPGEVFLDLRNLSHTDEIKPDVYVELGEKATAALAMIVQNLHNRVRTATMEAADELVTVASGIVGLLEKVPPVDKLETQLLESMEFLEAAEKRIAKLESEVSRLGGELQTERQAHVTETERANKAEQKLRAFREALKEDL